MPKKRIDMHFHVLGNGRDIEKVDDDVFCNFDDNHVLFTRFLESIIQGEFQSLKMELDDKGYPTTEGYLEYAYQTLKSSTEIDGIVLLALDGCFDKGAAKPDPVKTDLYVSNKFLAGKVKELNGRLVNEHSDKRFYFGASVSPNRRDWEDELDYVLESDAVLVKLIPSAQHVDLEEVDPEFYEKLARREMPLLCHVGGEYSFPEGWRNTPLDHYEKLRAPLDCGVTVIAAHCATPVFPLLEENNIQEFYRFMEDANKNGPGRLFGDTSAFSLSTRVPFLKEIRKTFPPKWLLHGSDFPIPIDAWPHLPWVNPDIDRDEYRRIEGTGNPLDRDVWIKKAHDFEDSILENAENILAMPS
jgi:hypothetical protein